MIIKIIIIIIIIIVFIIIKIVIIIIIIIIIITSYDNNKTLVNEGYTLQLEQKPYGPPLQYSTAQKEVTTLRLVSLETRVSSRENQ